MSGLLRRVCRIRPRFEFFAGVVDSRLLQGYYRGMAHYFTDVDPGDLRLAPGRQDGPVPARYHDQVRRFGASTQGMPSIEVSRGKDGELMINNGVTRATRIHYLSPGQRVRVLVSDIRPKADFSRLKKVSEVPPP